ncbi:MAG: hypothetical protein FWE21_00595 [Defluviitaleaceae bacterium]|nr:hypothetical protein [Defluviitaleaceae bacterium]
MRRFLTLLATVALTFGVATTALANPGQNPNQNPGSYEKGTGGVTVTVTGGGNNLVIRAICNDSDDYIIVPRAGNGTFSQTFEAFGHIVTIRVQGNSLVSVELAKPYVPAPPLVINLGFIGWFIHESRPEAPIQTSFFWLELNEGDMIDWDAVDAAYAAWVAQGGLAPDRTLWRTSGHTSFTFEDYAAIGHADFSMGQIETFYRAFFVCPGFVLPTNSCPDYEEELHNLFVYLEMGSIWNHMTINGFADFTQYYGAIHSAALAYHGVQHWFGSAYAPAGFVISLTGLCDDWYEYWSNASEATMALWAIWSVNHTEGIYSIINDIYNAGYVYEAVFYLNWFNSVLVGVGQPPRGI